MIENFRQYVLSQIFAFDVDDTDNERATRDALHAPNGPQPAPSRAKRVPVPQDVRDAASRAADEELRWLHAVKRGGTPLSTEEAQAVATIEAWLVLVPIVCRGAIGLRHSNKTWPAALDAYMDGYTALAMRLHCKAKRCTGSTAALEQAAAAEFDARLRDGKREGLGNLHADARRYYERALRAYVKARQFGPCVIPAAQAGEASASPAESIPTAAE